MKDSDRVEGEAANWLIREDRGLDLKERAAFELWLSRNLAHRVSYLRLKATWRKADQLSALGDFIPRARLSGAGRFWGVTPRTIELAALAAALLFMIGLLETHVFRPQDRVIVTAAGQHHNLTLSDGTMIELSGNTSLKTMQTESGRAVTLNYGLSYFDVVHDESHPFVVYAGDRKITDLGTKFSVYRNGDNIKIVVEKGRVRVDMLGVAAAAPVIVDQHKTLVAKGDETLVAPWEDSRNAHHIGPLPELLVFDNETLEGVAKEFNKYNKQQIRVAADARDIKIAGSFRADNVGGFKLLLRQAFNVKVTEDEGGVYVSR